MKMIIPNGKNEPTAQVLKAAVDIEAMQPELSRLIWPNGKIVRSEVTDALSRFMTDSGFRPSGSHVTFAGSEIDSVNPSTAVGISIQAGRGWTNNGAVMATLGAAADPRVRWLVLIAPQVYKGSRSFGSIVTRTQELLASPGIELDLDGVIAIAY
jgi:hypothetical protein